MKKQLKKKLTLARETLTDLEMREARGGVYFTEPPISGCVSGELGGG